MIVYCEDKETLKDLKRSLGEPDANYFHNEEEGRFKGSHWFISRELGKELKKRFGKKIEALK